MKFERAYIPLGAAWTSPFSKWQGSLAGLSSLDLAVQVTSSALNSRGIDPAGLTDFVLGTTVPQPRAFFGAPTVAARIGAPRLPGPMIAQACATSVAVLSHAATAVELSALDQERQALAVTTDRTSNGPYLIFPSASGRVHGEDCVRDNFASDPLTDESMTVTADRVAAEGGFSRQELDELTLYRYEQYQRALADNRAFQKRYFVPVVIESRRGTTVVEADEGVHPSSAEALRSLAPSLPGGQTTSGSQTHPADGSAGAVVTTHRKAKELGRDGGTVQILATATARAERGMMPKAPVPAAQQALADAGLAAGQIDLVTTHNPFTVNDLWLSRELEFPQDRINVYGSSLVYGHPQAPTGMRALAELIEALAERGGGYGLFTGCAAGDSGAAAVVKVA